jgi:hypothetical protein
VTRPRRAVGPLSVGDPDTLKTRLCREMCTTCVFKPGNPMHLERGRLKTLIDEALAAERFIICHSTLPHATSDPGVKPAVCRGFYDRYTTTALRMIAVMFGFTDIDPPQLNPSADQPTPSAIDTRRPNA